MHDQSAFRAQLRQRLGDERQPLPAEHAQQLLAGVGGVGQRSQQVEHCAHAEFTAHRGDMAHRGMVQRREHKPDADLLDALRDLFGREVQVHAQRFQHIGTAALAADGAVAVLGDGYARRRDHERRRRREVPSLQRVAARAAGVQQVRVIDGNLHRVGAHGACEADQLLQRLAARAHRHQHARNLHRRQRAVHHRVHQRLRLSRV
jgi:hypothetical protein